MTSDSATRCKHCVRYAFLVANGIVWGTCLALICHTLIVFIIGSDVFQALTITKAIIYLSLICGVGAFVTGMIGCCAGVRLNRKFFTGYLVMCIISIVIGIVTIILVVVMASQTSLSGWLKMTSSAQASIQSTYSCCGYEDPIAEASSSDLLLDLSCYNVTDVGGGVEIYVPFTTGCKIYLSDALESNNAAHLALLGCIVASLAFGITTGGVILKKLKKIPSEEKLRLHISHEGKPKHSYRQVTGPVEIDSEVFKEKDR